MKFVAIDYGEKGTHNLHLVTNISLWASLGVVKYNFLEFCD